MRYISLFSGIGGLEFKNVNPLMCCEIDEKCHKVLKKSYPSTEIYPDVTRLTPPSVDVVVGGWPCQDLSIAGKRAGLGGKNSSLFYHLVRIAKESKATTLIAENVPNLLKINGGETFKEVVKTLYDTGWKNISWRVLNARAFGLPQQRKRLFIIASKDAGIAHNLFRPIESTKSSVPSKKTKVAGFYTTAGSRSLCYSVGYTPTLKVGSSLSIPSPPGIHYGEVVRKLTSDETIKLQGFTTSMFEDVKKSDVFRMMGNAVALPAGEFATESCVVTHHKPDLEPTSDRVSEYGFYNGQHYKIQDIPEATLAENLEEFIDMNEQDRLSTRASSGIVRRLGRSGVSCDPDLYKALQRYSKNF